MPRYAGRFANLPQAWEFPLVRFLERYGYDVTHTTDVDTDRDPAELLRHRLVMTAGHGSIRFATELDPSRGRGDPRLQRFMRNALADLSRHH